MSSLTHSPRVSRCVQVATCIAIMFGVLCMAMPLAIVGSNFQEAWNERWTVSFIEHVQSHLLENRQMAYDLVSLFNRFSEREPGSQTRAMRFH